MDQKICFKCKIMKPLSEFYKHSRMKDGYLNKCKECTKKDVQKYRIDNIDHIKEYERSRAMLPHRMAARKQYLSTDKGKMARKKAIQKYRENNRIKQRASNKVAYYLRKGYIKKEPCAICGSKDTEAHHPDYNYPLKIIWLCHKHHYEIHKKDRHPFLEA